MTLLSIKNMKVSFEDLVVLENFDFSINEGEIVGVVGESGSGKSVSMLALMGLLEAPGVAEADEIIFKDYDLLNMKRRNRRSVLGNQIAMIFQDPGTSLDPSYTIEDQISESIKAHTNLRGAALNARILELLDQVEIPAPKKRMKSYPHELSGGMKQRVMIAIALSCNPKLLIADEPTTALDVTIQSQIMDLLLEAQKAYSMGLILISHDLAVVAEIAERVLVMYAGEIVEENTVPEIFEKPTHPYTEALLQSIPENKPTSLRLKSLPGVVPGPKDRPSGCLLSPRCPYAEKDCHAIHPHLLSPRRQSAATYRKDSLYLDEKSLTSHPSSSHALTRCIKPLNQ